MTNLARNWERTTLRVTITYLGKNVVCCRSGSEDKIFALTVKDEIQSQLVDGQVLDAHMRVQRGDDGQIAYGELLEVHPLTAGDPLAAWRDWFAENVDVEATIASLKAEGRWSDSQ